MCVVSTPWPWPGLHTAHGDGDLAPTSRHTFIESYSIAYIIRDTGEIVKILGTWSYVLLAYYDVRRNIQIQVEMCISQTQTQCLCLCECESVSGCLLVAPTSRHTLYYILLL